MLLNPRDAWFINPPAQTFCYLLITDFSWCVQEQQDSGFTRGSWLLGEQRTQICKGRSGAPQHCAICTDLSLN